MSRLEAFRKQAKQLVRWHRDGNYSIGGRIRGLERYRTLTDAQALQLKFPLSEAQEIIGREAGFASWAELKRALENESPASKPPGRAAAIRAAIPVVFVSSVADSANFYRDKLGFSVEFLHGNPPFYGAVRRDGATIHLRFVHEPVVTQVLREKESLLAAFLSVENAKELFDEFKTKDVPMAGSLHREPWGGPTFTVRDPDGNWICFCQA
ncbi:MAG TPA: VOC family protein [Steroidobacteraceae bacterium]